MKKYKNLIEKQRELIFVYTTNFNYGSPYTDQLESEIAAIEKEIEEEEQPTDEEIEMYARKIYKNFVYNSEYRGRKDAYAEGAKAMRDNPEQFKSK